MKRILFLSLFLFPLAGFAVNDSTMAGNGAKPGGLLMLGVRSTSSLFSHGSSPGLGVGGQFRVRLSKRVNTDWFSDYITGNMQNLGKRTDYHIGWSVLFYLVDPESQRSVSLSRHTRGFIKQQPRRIVPYILAGHCFDYTHLVNNSVLHPESTERWSSAIQGGAGVHFPVKQVGDISFTSQYMMHLGTDIHSEVITQTAPVNDKWLVFHEETGGSLEGHLLVTLSFNVRITDLWSR